MSIIEVKNRIKAVKNIGQITKAMEVVAATKMRKSQQVALNSRPYAFKALQLLSVLAEHVNVSTSQDETFKVKTELMRSRKIKKTLLVIVTSDRGLAGSFNSQVLRLADTFLRSYQDTNNEGLKVVAVGKKAISYANNKRLLLAGEFFGFGDFINPKETDPVEELLIKGFLNKDWDRVITISTHFRSTLKQEVLMRQVLPVDMEKIKKTLEEIIPEHGRFSEFKMNVKHSVSNKVVDYIFEPSPKELIEGLVDHLVRMQVYHLVLEANASEHSARMVAMKTASDNAKELSEKLNLEYNKVRQAGITKELIEITSAVSILQ
ncbi:MAG: ATP synthase F1 subunit gamma [bacterium]|nr:ATP synthase F1 subunit gamma [bacterium]